MNLVGETSIMTTSPLFWQREGEGADLVLIHGWGMNGAVWRSGQLVLNWESGGREKFSKSKLALEVLGVCHEVVLDNVVVDEDLYHVGYFRTDGDIIGCDIHPDFRRRGYARKAYEKYLEDTDYAELWVFEDNHAKKLYEELGFKETGEVKFIRDRKYLKMIYENRD